MPKSIFLLFLLTVPNLIFGEIGDANIRLKVLKYNNTGKEYKFSNKDSTITYLKYLGYVKTKKGAMLKILNSTWIWGLSKRATNKILVYNQHNHYIGEYRVDMTYDLPNELKQNKLVFFNSDNVNSGCDLQLVTYINLYNGIPKLLFIKCRGDEGDLYSFENNQE